MRETFDPDGTLSLTLVGELDWTFCDDVEARLRGLQDAECEVRFDLSQLEFLDSAGVRALLRGLEGARCHGRPVASARTSTVPWSRPSHAWGSVGTSGQRQLT